MLGLLAGVRAWRSPIRILPPPANVSPLGGSPMPADSFVKMMYNYCFTNKRRENINGTKLWKTETTCKCIKWTTPTEKGIDFRLTISDLRMSTHPPIWFASSRINNEAILVYLCRPGKSQCCSFCSTITYSIEAKNQQYRSIRFHS